MKIRLETSKRTGIANESMGPVQAGALLLFKIFEKDRKGIRRRTEPTSSFNCHGLTFGGRRAWISDSWQVLKCLKDDEWIEVSEADSLEGDIVVYFGEKGDANHSGIVVGKEAFGVAKICSKWGAAGEYIHRSHDVLDYYGPNRKFYRCSL